MNAADRSCLLRIKSRVRLTRRRVCSSAFNEMLLWEKQVRTAMHLEEKEGKKPRKKVVFRDPSTLVISVSIFQEFIDAVRIGFDSTFDEFDPLYFVSLE